MTPPPTPPDGALGRQSWEIDRCAICECDLDGGAYVAGVGSVCFECEDREFAPTSPVQEGGSDGVA